MRSPTCIRALYGIPKAHLSDPVNVMGLFEEGDAFAQKDLDLFWKNYAPNVPQGTGPTVKSVDGGVTDVAPGSPLNTGESDIDLDLSISLIYPQSVTVYQVDDPPNALGEIITKGCVLTPG
jgi:tripeptidyl-peptidase I